MIYSGHGIADTDFRVSIESSQVQGSMNLGKAFVEGLGEISLTASKNGNQLVIHAQDPKGEFIGKAETVIGLEQTPIYVLTADGLKKITIHWGIE